MYAKFHVGDWSEKSESNQTNEISFHIILQMYWGQMNLSHLGIFSFLVPYYRCIKYHKERKIITCLTSTLLLLFEHVHNVQQILHKASYKKDSLMHTYSLPTCNPFY